MRAVVHLPFATMSEECGAVSLLARYLSGLRHQVHYLRCNGVFSLCDRDEHTHWQRGLENCFNCSREQQSIAEWSEGQVLDLSGFMEPRDITDTKEWLSAQSSENLCTARWSHELTSEYVPYELCRGSFSRRFGGGAPDLKNRLHEQVIRRLMLSAVRMSLASARVAENMNADLFIVAGGRDYISASLVAELSRRKKPLSRFEWKSSRRVVEVSQPQRDGTFDCGIVLPGMSAMRADYKTWPAELVGMVESMVRFLGIETQQIALSAEGA